MSSTTVDVTEEGVPNLLLHECSCSTLQVSAIKYVNKNNCPHIECNVSDGVNFVPCFIHMEAAKKFKDGNIKENGTFLCRDLDINSYATSARSLGFEPNFLAYGWSVTVDNVYCRMYTTTEIIGYVGWNGILFGSAGKCNCSENTKKSSVTMKDCYVFSKTDKPVFGGNIASMMGVIDLQRCGFVYENNCRGIIGNDWGKELSDRDQLNIRIFECFVTVGKEILPNCGGFFTYRDTNDLFQKTITFDSCYVIDKSIDVMILLLGNCYYIKLSLWLPLP